MSPNIENYIKTKYYKKYYMNIKVPPIRSKVVFNNEGVCRFSIKRPIAELLKLEKGDIVRLEVLEIEKQKK